MWNAVDTVERRATGTTTVLLRCNCLATRRSHPAGWSSKSSCLETKKRIIKCKSTRQFCTTRPVASMPHEVGMFGPPGRRPYHVSPLSYPLLCDPLSMDQKVDECDLITCLFRGATIFRPRNRPKYHISRYAYTPCWLVIATVLALPPKYVFWCERAAVRVSPCFGSVAQGSCSS